MEARPLFSLGNHQVDRSQVNAETVARMAAGAGNIRVKENPSPQEWKALADRVTRADAVSEEDLQTLQDLGKKCWSHHKKLHAEFRDSGYKDRKLAGELADVHVYLEGSDAIRDALKLSQARVAVQALAGASFGPTGLVTAYAANANLAEDAVKSLVSELQDLRDGSSKTVYRGNKAQGFHAEEVWKEMQAMLDGAVASGRAGKPVEVDAQYYELTSQQMVGKLAEAAEAGCKVRVNVDVGRLVAFKGDHVEIDEVPDKLRSLLQLAAAKGHVGISAYPVPRELGEPGNLMHRKGLRVGDQFLLSGMNANEGSGENIDVGYRIEGPAARRLGQNFARDVGVSAGAPKEDLYGAEPLAAFQDGDINLGPRGLIALFDCQQGPSPAGTPLPRASTFQELEAVAKQYGQKLADYVDAPPARVDELLSQDDQIPLSASGKKKVLELIDRTVAATRTPENLARLKDIEPPSGKPSGDFAVALADLPTEREAVMLTAIQNAKEFIYIPAFVMTRTVGSMIVAKAEEARAQGKELDIRVIADPGVYPDGGTPNEIGVKLLEDAGIPVRWALLPRSGWHDRKIHAKQILTDQGEFFGSTNFSNKGLRENWEHSGYVAFDEKDPASLAERDHARARFLEMWDHESFALNSLEKGRAKRSRSRDDKDFESQADEARYGIIRDVISGIEKVEEAIGAYVEGQARDPRTAARVAELEKQGYDEGSAVLVAVKEKLGPEAFYAALQQLPERRELDRLK